MKVKISHLEGVNPVTKTDMPPTEVEAPLGQLTFFQKLAKKDVYWHLAFGGLLLGSAIWFIFWAFDYVGETDQALLLVITIAFAVFMAFNIGGNDVANSFGTSVGAGTLSMKQALVVAAIFEVSGAVIAGGEVTDTVRSGIVDLSAISNLQAIDFALIMASCLLGAAVWLVVATRLGGAGSMAGINHPLDRRWHRRCCSDRRLYHPHRGLEHGAMGRHRENCDLLGTVPGIGRGSGLYLIQID